LVSFSASGPGPIRSLTNPMADVEIVAGTRIATHVAPPGENLKEDAPSIRSGV
jgi:hypothetical protein